MKSILSLLLITFSMNSFAITGEEFVNCFEKAINERIQEVRNQYPDQEMCDQVSSLDIDRIYELYSFIEGGKLYFYNDREMGAMNVRFHYERIMYEVNCYPRNNLLVAWFKAFGEAVGVNKHSDFILIEDALTKMLGRKMWTKNGSDKFSEHSFEYCSK